MRLATALVSRAFTRDFSRNKDVSLIITKPGMPFRHPRLDVNMLSRLVCEVEYGIDKQRHIGDGDKSIIVHVSYAKVYLVAGKVEYFVHQ